MKEKPVRRSSRRLAKRLTGEATVFVEKGSSSTSLASRLSYGVKGGTPLLDVSKRQKLLDGILN